MHFFFGRSFSYGIEILLLKSYPWHNIATYLLLLYPLYPEICLEQICCPEFFCNLHQPLSLGLLVSVWSQFLAKDRKSSIFIPQTIQCSTFKAKERGDFQWYILSCLLSHCSRQYCSDLFWMGHNVTISQDISYCIQLFCKLIWLIDTKIKAFFEGAPPVNGKKGPI